MYLAMLVCPWISAPLPPRHIRKVKLVERMPGLGVLELSAVLQKGLVADDDHVALVVQVEMLEVVRAAGHGLDGALRVADLQLQGLFDVLVNRVLGDAAIQAGDQVGDEVVDIQDHPPAIDTPDPLDAGDQGAFFALDVLAEAAFER